VVYELYLKENSLLNTIHLVATLISELVLTTPTNQFLPAGYCGSLEYDLTYFKYIACWIEEDSGNPKYPEMTEEMFFEFRREDGFNDPVIGINYVGPYN